VSLRSLPALLFLTLAGALAVGAVGCDDLPVQGVGDPSAVAEPTYSTGNAHGPIKATLSGPAAPQPGGEIALMLRLDRHLLAASAEVSVQLKLPEQVALRRGALHTRVLPDGEPVTELRYALQVDALPDSDVIVSVAAVGEGFGYHAELPYRFGRKGALPHEMLRSPASVTVGGRSFGAAVRIRYRPLPKFPSGFIASARK